MPGRLHPTLASERWLRHSRAAFVGCCRRRRWTGSAWLCSRLNNHTTTGCVRRLPASHHHNPPPPGPTQTPARLTHNIDIRGGLLFVFISPRAPPCGLSPSSSTHSHTHTHQPFLLVVPLPVAVSFCRRDTQEPFWGLSSIGQLARVLLALPRGATLKRRTQPAPPHYSCFCGHEHQDTLPPSSGFL